MIDDSRPAVVVFSTLFPSATQPYAGVFIRERMFRVAQTLPLTVVAPVPWFPFQSLIRRWRPHFRPDVPRREVQDGVEVLRPRFFSMPGVMKSLDGLFLALSSLSTMFRLRRTGRLDILDSHFAYPEGYAAGLIGYWLGVPVTVTMRGTEARHVLVRRLRHRILRALTRANRVFAVSASLKHLATDLGIPDGKVVVIGNGVDLDKFQRLPRDSARRAMGLPLDANVVISVGALVKRKGFHRVIDQLPGLLHDFPRLQYLIVGGAGPEGDCSRMLREQVSRLDLATCVRFLGPLDPRDLNIALSAADLFVLPTRNEGWANVFLEAMACGLPVITTNVGGNAEVVCRPELGTIVPKDDQRELGRAMEDAMRRRWDADLIVEYARSNGWRGRIAILVQEFRRLANLRQASGIPSAVEFHENKPPILLVASLKSRKGVKRGVRGQHSRK